MEMGVVRNCTENGKVTSTGNSYAGRVSGASAAAIRNCIVKVSVNALGYVGGIAGQGLILTDNAAILKVSGCAERTSSVAGFIDFSYKNTEVLLNRFVDRGTAGIDGISYAGVAIPADFAEFAALAGDTAVIEVKFIVDGEVTDSIRVDYGAALSPEKFPGIPAKEGCFAKWADFDNECVTFPVEVEAVYTPYVTVIESAEKSGEFPLVLADGHYLLMDNPYLTDGAGAFCVQVRQADYLPALVIGGVVILAAVNVVLWVILIKRKRAEKKRSQPSKRMFPPKKKRRCADKIYRSHVELAPRRWFLSPRGWGL